MEALIVTVQRVAVQTDNEWSDLIIKDVATLVQYLWLQWYNTFQPAQPGWPCSVQYLWHSMTQASLGSKEII